MRQALGPGALGGPGGSGWGGRWEGGSGWGRHVNPRPRKQKEKKKQKQKNIFLLHGLKSRLVFLRNSYEALAWNTTFLFSIFLSPISTPYLQTSLTSHPWRHRAENGGPLPNTRQAVVPVPETCPSVTFQALSSFLTSTAECGLQLLGCSQLYFTHQFN